MLTKAFSSSSVKAYGLIKVLLIFKVSVFEETCIVLAGSIFKTGG